LTPPLIDAAAQRIDVVFSVALPTTVTVMGSAELAAAEIFSTMSAVFTEKFSVPVRFDVLLYVKIPFVLEPIFFPAR
jgi:hypothetical protein